MTKHGNRAYYQADQTSPFFSELQSIMRKSTGGVDVIRDALQPLQSEITAAFLYGSFVRQCDLRNSSDVDLMVIGDVRPRQLTEALSGVEQELGREVNPTVYTPNEFKQKLAQGHHFLTAVMHSEKLPIIGNTDVLAAAPQPREGSSTSDKPS
jgi:predicted nucleotidyltransferase